MKPENFGARPRNLALFIDIENFVATASTLGLPITLEPILGRLKEEGRVLLRRSYGDLKKCLEASGRYGQYDSIRRMFHENLVQMEDVPYITTHKNTADLQLVVEALSVAYTNPEITTFAVLSSDRDYVPLYNKLHEIGKSVITIPIDRDNVHRMILEAADLVFYYENFFTEERTAPVSVNGKEEPSKPVVRSSLYEEFARALQQSIRAIQNDGQACVGAYIRTRLGQIRSDFDPALIEHPNFKSFIQQAEKDGYIRVDWRDGKHDFVAELGENTSLLTVPVRAPRAADDKETRRVARAVSRFLEEKMRTPIPDFETRARIIEAADYTFTERMKTGSFLLEDWKELTLQYLRDNGHHIDQRVVFKILLSLYFSRCLFCEAGPDKANPWVTGRRIQSTDWEGSLVANWINQVSRESDIRDADGEVYAHVFYPGQPDAPERLQAVMGQVAAR